MSVGIVFFGNLFQIFAWEIQLIALTRKFSDGITFFSFKINLDIYKNEHNPLFMLEFTIFNIYNHFMIYKR